MTATTQASPQMAHVSSGALPGTDVPAQFDQMWQFAEALAKADLYLPERLRGKPGNVLALMLRAHALNIPLAVAWDELYVSRGRVGQTAKLVRALLRRAGHRIAYAEADQYHAVALIQCADETTPHKVSFTMQEAHALGLTDPEKNNKGGQWDRQPKDMLIARVTTRAANWHCPEVLLGLGDEYEEADESVEVSSDIISAYQEEHRAKVVQTLRAAEDLEQERDGEARLTGLRELFLQARQDMALDYAADDTEEYSVRQVLTEKLRAADALAKKQAADPEYRKDAPPDTEEQAAPEENGKTAAKKAAKKPAKKPAKKAAKKAARKADKTAPPADTTQEQPSESESSQSDTRPPGRTGSRSAARPTERETGQPDDRTLPCGCSADDVIRTGKHTDICTGAR